MISCAEAVEQLWSYLSGELASPDRAAVERHLTFCRRCCGEVEFAEELRGLLGTAAHVELPGEVEAQLTRVLDDLGQGAAPPTRRRPPPSPTTEGQP